MRLKPTDGLRFFEEMFKTYGNSLGIAFIGVKSILTINPEDIEHVLSSNFENFKRIDVQDPKTPWRFKAFFGKGIFAANGSSWSQQRNAARAYFTIHAIEDYVPIFAVKAAELGDELAKRSGSVEMQDMFMRFTLDSFGLMGFGFDFNSIKLRPEFPDAFDFLQQRLEGTLRSPLTRNSADPEFSQAMARVDRVMYDLIAQRKKEDWSQRVDLLSRFMRLVDDTTGKPYEDEWLRDVLFNLLIGECNCLCVCDCLF
jgi:cytochrome P450